MYTFIRINFTLILHSIETIVNSQQCFLLNRSESQNIMIKKMEELSAYRYLIIALRELLHDYPFEKITIQMISNKAGINRSTFYLNFQDKYELYDILTEEILMDLLTVFSVKSFDGKNPEKIVNQSIIEVCEHLKSNITFYIPRFKNLDFIHHLFEQLYQVLYDFYQDETFASFTSYGIIGFWGKWIQDGCQKTPADIANALQTMAFNYNWVSNNDKP